MKIIHVKYERTELGGLEDFFNLEATIIPAIEKKSYYFSIGGNTSPAEMGHRIGEFILPELIFVNAHDEE